jgi:choline dehydrogenase-like flavoprotein
VLYHFGLRVREKYAGPPRLGEPTHGIKASPNVTRARSEGAVRLASADPRAKPVIELRYLSDPEGYDQRILLAGMRFARRIGETDVMRKLIRAEVSPGPAVQSHDEWIGYMRSVCETVYHASGTCVMGDPSERRVVVGPDLRVKGIAGLSVCDASVFPAMVTTNINFTVMMLAEKAADCILP